MKYDLWYKTEHVSVFINTYDTREEAESVKRLSIARATGRNFRAEDARQENYKINERA